MGMFRYSTFNYQDAHSLHPNWPHTSPLLCHMTWPSCPLSINHMPMFPSSPTHRSLPLFSHSINQHLGFPILHILHWHLSLIISVLLVFQFLQSTIFHNPKEINTSIPGEEQRPSKSIGSYKDSVEAKKWFIYICKQTI